MRRYDQNSAERILAAVSKRLLQLKAIDKEQPIIIFSMAGELARIKLNLIMDPTTHPRTEVGQMGSNNGRSPV